MEAKTSFTKNNLKRYLTIGGLGIAVFGLSYYLIKRFTGEQSDEETKDRRLSKELVMKILREIRRAYFPLMKDMADTCRMVAERHGLKDIPEESKIKIFESQLAAMKAVKTKVVEKYGLTLPEFNEISAVDYKDDEEVQKFEAFIMSEFTSALTDGLVINTTIPEFLTKQKVLEIMAKIIKGSFENMHKMLQESGQEFKVSLADPAIVQKIVVSERIMREELLDREGLGNFDDHPEKILEYAKFVYMKSDEEFRNKISVLNAQGRMAHEKLQNQSEDVSDFIAAIGKHIFDDVDGNAN